jgi:hypothetical protein
MNAYERPIITEENKTAMRAGATGDNVRYVLIGSVALAILAWILAERQDREFAQRSGILSGLSSLKGCDPNRIWGGSAYCRNYVSP